MSGLVKMNGFIKIATDDESYFVKTSGKDELEKMQEAVEGYIEVFPETLKLDCGNYAVICNEEGLIKGLEINEIASWLMNYPIQGNVVIAKMSDDLEMMDISEAVQVVEAISKRSISHGVEV